MKIPGVWKPGTKKEPEAAAPTTNTATTTPKQRPSRDGRGSAAGSSGKTKLSGATMNMRFMRKKTEEHSAEKKKAEDRRREMEAWRREEEAEETAAAAAAEAEAGDEQQPTTRPDDGDESSPIVDDANHEREECSTTTTPATAATFADMHAVVGGEVLLGRRSFGGFNQAAEDAWKESHDAAKNRTSSKKKRRRTEELSDEELLRRYKRYVRDGDTGASPVPIGNLAEKKNKGNYQHRKRGRSV